MVGEKIDYNDFAKKPNSRMRAVRVQHLTKASCPPDGGYLVALRYPKNKIILLGRIHNPVVPHIIDVDEEEVVLELIDAYRVA